MNVSERGLAGYEFIEWDMQLRLGEALNWITFGFSGCFNRGLIKKMSQKIEVVVALEIIGLYKGGFDECKNLVSGD